MKKAVIIIAIVLFLVGLFNSCMGNKKCPAYTNKEQVER